MFPNRVGVLYRQFNTSTKIRTERRKLLNELLK